MAQLAEVKEHAARLFARGDALHALRLYDAAIAAAPTDFDARIRAADCLAAVGDADAAAVIYREVAWYALKAGHPLVAIVCARLLEAAGRDADDLLATLVVYYGSESELLGKLGGRIPLPAADTPVQPPDLRAPPPAEFTAAAADRAAHCLANFDHYPESLHPIPLLSELSEDAFRRVLKTLVVRRLPDGAHVIREGEPGESFYFVASGTVTVYDTDGLGRRRDLARLSENAVFGEMALLSRKPRSASVVCAGDVDLLEVTRGSLAALADELAAVADALHRFTRDRLLRNLMATSPLFRPFSRPQRLDLLRRFTAHDVAPGTPIIHEGDDGRGLFVVLSGELDVTKAAPDGGTLPLATLRAGDVFGEMALVRGGPTTATVTAASPATVLFLAREVVDRLVAGVPEIRQYLDGLAESRYVDTQIVVAGDDAVDDGLDPDDRVLV
ncbi:MAG: cyclic nucleotide-binding domain-containing protein [Deltaproteobacteria bacterium]|nr:MAG: cyclic nucleotide-binding domain-containing protein [Deltaproteobacteria bacterium]